MGQGLWGQHDRTSRGRQWLLCAKLLQSCLTLCDSVDRSPPGPSVHGDSPGTNAGVGCHFLLKGIFPPRNHTRVSSMGRQVLHLLLVPPGVTGEAFREMRLHVGDTKLGKQRCPYGLPTTCQPRLGIRGHVQG